MNLETKPLAAALATIAAFFTDEVTTMDGKTRNELAYPQEKMLNGICWAVVGQIAYTEQQGDKAKAELEKALRAYRADEISINEVQYKTHRCQGIEYQKAHLMAFRDVALSTYEKVTGKAYVHRTGSSKAMPVDETLALAEAILGKQVSAAADVRSVDATGDKAQTARKRA